MFVFKLFALKELTRSDMYSLRCLVWVLGIGGRESMEIVTMVSRGDTFRLDREKLAHSKFARVYAPQA